MQALPGNITTFKELDSWNESENKIIPEVLMNVIKDYAVNENDFPKKYSKITLNKKDKVARFSWSLLNFISCGLVQKKLNAKLRQVVFGGKKIADVELYLKRGAKLISIIERNLFIGEDHDSYEFVCAQLENLEEHDKFKDFIYHYTRDKKLKDNDSKLLDLYLRYHPMNDLSDKRTSLKSVFHNAISCLNDRDIVEINYGKATLNTFFNRGFQFGSSQKYFSFVSTLQGLNNESLTFLRENGLKFEANSPFVEPPKFQKIKFTFLDKIKLIAWKIFNVLSFGSSKKNQSRELMNALYKDDLDLAKKYLKRGVALSERELLNIDNRETFTFMCAQTEAETLIKEFSSTFESRYQAHERLDNKSKFLKIMDQLEIYFKNHPKLTLNENSLLKNICYNLLTVNCHLYRTPRSEVELIRDDRANQIINLFVKHGFKLDFDDLKNRLCHITTQNLALLSQAGVNFDQGYFNLNGNFTSFLLEKIKEKDIDVVRAIIETQVKKPDPKAHYQNYPNVMTPLHMAIKVKSVEIATLLIAKGDDPEKWECNINGERTSAAKYARDTDFANILPVRPNPED